MAFRMFMADTSDAVMFGAGYAIAHDRLAAMELARHNTQGRRAELVGKSAIESDKMMRGRRLSDAQLLQRYRALAPEHQKMIQAMVDGINKRIDEVNADPEAKTPLEFIRWGIRPTRWSLAEYLALISAAPLGRDTYEIRNLEFLKAMTRATVRTRRGRSSTTSCRSPTPIPRRRSQRATIWPLPGRCRCPFSPRRSWRRNAIWTSAAAQTAPTEPVKGASRCMVIGPEKSASGKVLMLEATADGPEIHLKGGGFDNTGFGSTGWGVPTMGRGAQHGWLLVSGSSEAGTTFAEKLNPEEPYEYWYKGAWKKMEHRTEAFTVKDGKPFTHEVAWTIHGPVIAWDIENGTAYSQQMGVHGRELDTWIAFAEMGRAKSLAEFKDQGRRPPRLESRRLLWRRGRHDRLFRGRRAPKKAAGVDPRLPTPGTGEYEWTGFLTPAKSRG
jgi:penicillin amidase